MIVTDDFIFIHLHKAGGSFIGKVILALFPGAKRLGYHYPLACLPQAYRGLPVLGSVRSPWEFYVSYHAFQQRLVSQFETAWRGRPAGEYDALCRSGIDPRNGIDILFDTLCEMGEPSFAEVTTRLLDLSASPATLERLLALLPAERDRRGRYTPVQRDGFRGMNLTSADLAPLRDRDEGFYSFLFQHMYAGAVNPFFVRNSHLREDLLTFFDQLGCRLTPARKRYIFHAAPENVTPHADPGSYYTPALADRVGRKERYLVERFGFQPVRVGH